MAAPPCLTTAACLCCTPATARRATAAPSRRRCRWGLPPQMPAGLCVCFYLPACLLGCLWQQLQLPYPWPHIPPAGLHHRHSIPPGPRQDRQHDRPDRLQPNLSHGARSAELSWAELDWVDLSGAGSPQGPAAGASPCCVAARAVEFELSRCICVLPWCCRRRGGAA